MTVFLFTGASFTILWMQILCASAHYSTVYCTKIFKMAKFQVDLRYFEVAWQVFWLGPALGCTCWAQEKLQHWWLSCWRCPGHQCCVFSWYWALMAKWGSCIKIWSVVTEPRYVLGQANWSNLFLIAEAACISSLRQVEAVSGKRRTPWKWTDSDSTQKLESKYVCINKY